MRPAIMCCHLGNRSGALYFVEELQDVENASGGLDHAVFHDERHRCWQGSAGLAPGIAAAASLLVLLLGTIFLRWRVKIHTYDNNA